MTDISTLRLGSSCCFFRDINRDVMQAAKAAGIDALELSFSYDKYMNSLDLPRTAAALGETARDIGIELWSLHLPFSRKLDISNQDKELRAITLYTNKTLIRAAAEAGIKTMVLHPSSEPITDDIRPDRLALSRDGIMRLGELCDKLGLTLAVENLPRTCLCNRSAEMVELLSGTGAKVCFDTNHSLAEDNLDYLRGILAGGLEIVTLHISDYDFVDERHRLPGDGFNNWKGLLSILAEANYAGPLMYEVPAQPKERDVIALETLADNMKRLRAGLI
ncbi:MAG: sugar phosphate isomerase/epimerase [Clostridia bacterium]|nr:sugar phosphate isomerase/epimerase [Clostridia bacterium]